MRNAMIATRLAMKTAELRELSDDLYEARKTLPYDKYILYKEVIMDEVVDLIKDILRLSGLSRYIEEGK